MLEQLGAGPSFRTITDIQIMGKSGFSCQLSLSEIGLTTDSSHSTWFQKTARFSRSKSSRFSMKKIWLSMLYSIRVGEEPDPVVLIKQNQVKMIRINPSSCAKDLTISEGTGVPSLFHFHSRVLMSFHAPLRPRKMDKFLFLGTHTRFVTTKRIMVSPPLTTSFMNFIVIEIHVLPRQNL
jgi:hypothetical protein